MTYVIGFIVMLVFVLWAITGFYAMTTKQPYEMRCDDGYVLIAGVSIMGWPGRWTCVPGKDPQ